MTSSKERWIKEHPDKIKEYNHRQYLRRRENKEQTEAIRQRSKEYYYANRERLNAMSKEYYQENKERINELCKQDRQNNPDKYRAYERSTPEQIERKRQQSRDYYWRNRERILEKMRLDRIAEPERFREYGRRAYYKGKLSNKILTEQD